MASNGAPTSSLGRRGARKARRRCKARQGLYPRLPTSASLTHSRFHYPPLELTNTAPDFFPNEAVSILCVVPRVHRYGGLTCVARGRCSFELPRKGLTPDAGLQAALSSPMRQRPGDNGWSCTAGKRKACWMNIGSGSRHVALSPVSSRRGVSPRSSSTTFWSSHPYFPRPRDDRGSGAGGVGSSGPAKVALTICFPPRSGTHLAGVEAQVPNLCGTGCRRCE